MPFLLCCKESSPVVINNFFFLYSRTFTNVRANQTQHDRSLGEKEKNTAQRAEKKSGLMNIHVAIGLGVRCLRELWAVAKWFVWQETAKKKKKKSFFFSPLTISKMSMSQTRRVWLCVPTSDSQNPNFNSFSSPFFPSVSKFWQKSVVCEVVLSRMANKQSHLRTGQSTLQHFKHLFQLTACLTSAG